MKEQFIDWRPQKRNRILLEQCQAIAEEYSGQDYKLTLRQVFYVLLGRALIKSSETMYKALGKLIGNARKAGLIDWDTIEDRGRQADRPTEFDSLGDLIDTALAWYRLPRWEGQKVYAELWVEKAALAGVLQPMADRYHVTLMVNKGYSSLSAMYESAKRIREGTRDGEIPATIFYLGDHDPSGLDMARDIREKLATFTHGEIPFKVEMLALTTEQVRHYNPPPNPTKLQDTRAKKYIEEFGRECWEVDALPPDVLQQIITDAFDEVIDRDLMDKVKAREEADKAELREALARG